MTSTVDTVIEQSGSPAIKAADNDWRSHDGMGDPAIHGRTPVEVRFRDGDTAFGMVYDWDQNWQWAHTEAGRAAPGAIVAWRPCVEEKSEEVRARGLMDALTDRELEIRNFRKTMRGKTARQILAAVRRLVPRNRKPNWSLAMDVFCVGSTYGYMICREAGIDPDATKLTAYDMPVA